MKTLLAFMRRHSMLTYLALTFALSWGGYFLVAGVPPSLAPPPPPAAPGRISAS